MKNKLKRNKKRTVLNVFKKNKRLNSSISVQNLDESTDSYTDSEHQQVLSQAALSETNQVDTSLDISETVAYNENEQESLKTPFSHQTKNDTPKTEKCQKKPKLSKTTQLRKDLAGFLVDIFDNDYIKNSILKAKKVAFQNKLYTGL